jgi:hypothetical protein
VSDQHRCYFDRLAATVVLRQVIVLAEQSVGLTDAALRARLMALTEVAR